jgi:hypothetical protein
MKDFKAFSYISQTSKKIIGSQLIFDLTHGHQTAEPMKLNLIEDEVKGVVGPGERTNNLYNDALNTTLEGARQQLVQVGRKKMVISPDNKDLFICVISARLDEELIQNEVFSLHESLEILQWAIELQSCMKEPSLEYIILNTFDALKRKQFFINQGLLRGKSICDICIGDFQAVKSALTKFDPDKEVDLDHSAFEQILMDDFQRR